MTEPRSILFARTYLGRQELSGPNEGPVIGAMKAFLNVDAKGVSWCAIFVAWILCRAYGMDEKKLRMTLGFKPPWYSESTRDWRAQFKNRGLATDFPKPGDIGILIDKHGEAHHIFIVVSEPDEDGRLRTIEGNTNDDGSVNGDGVYERERNARNSVEFYALPAALKG